MGNLIFGSIKIQGRTFDDIKIQTSRAGVPRPIVWGKARPVIGNIIAATPPKIVKKRQKQSGKGAPSTVVTNEEVYRTYAIRICEGEVTGIPRVWRNNELVYDRDTEDSVQRRNNINFLGKATFFFGSLIQSPSSVMQAAFGIDNVHAYRGTCYLVIDNENLSDNGGAIPQYAFEVERCYGFYLTSKPYPYFFSDSLVADQAEVVEFPPVPGAIDNLEGSQIEVLSITLEDWVKYKTYTVPDPDELEGQQIEVLSVSLTPAVVYSSYDAGRDELEGNQIEAINVSLEQVVWPISYTNGEPDELEGSQIEVLSVSLTS